MRTLATESFRRGYIYVVRCYFRSYRAKFLLMKRLRALILPTQTVELAGYMEVLFPVMAMMLRFENGSLADVSLNKAFLVG